MADFTDRQGSLRSHCIDFAPFPGALAIVYVRAVNEAKTNPALVSDKPRPAVLSREKPNGWWLCWGLTGNSTFQDGVHRQRAPGLELCGLQPGYIWGGHAVQLPPEDIVGVVWAAPRELILACASNERGLSQSLAVAIARDLHEQHLESNWTWPKPKGA
jgi:hypothetical protein